MVRKNVLVAVIILAILLPGGYSGKVSAQQPQYKIILTSGKVVKGEIIKTEKEYIILQTSEGKKFRIDRKGIKKIIRYREVEEEKEKKLVSEKVVSSPLEAEKAGRELKRAYARKARGYSLGIGGGILRPTFSEKAPYEIYGFIPLVEVNLGVASKKPTSWQFGLGYERGEGKLDSKGEEAISGRSELNLFLLSSTIFYNFRKPEKLNPYLGGGLGLYQIEESRELGEYGSSTNQVRGMLVPIVAGLEYRFFPSWGVDSRISYSLTVYDNLEENADAGGLYITLGVKYHL